MAEMSLSGDQIRERNELLEAVPALFPTASPEQNNAVLDRYAVDKRALTREREQGLVEIGGYVPPPLPAWIPTIDRHIRARSQLLANEPTDGLRHRLVVLDWRLDTYSTGEAKERFRALEDLRCAIGRIEELWAQEQAVQERLERLSPATSTDLRSYRDERLATATQMHELATSRLKQEMEYVDSLWRVEKYDFDLYRQADFEVEYDAVLAAVTAQGGPGAAAAAQRAVGSVRRAAYG